MKLKRIIAIIAVVVAMLVLTSAVLAQSGGTFNLTWNSINGGGGRVTSSSYTMEGSIGQPYAGTLTSGSYSLTAGFQTQTEVATRHEVYLPAILK